MSEWGDPILEGPEGSTTVFTPSGMEIYFQNEPKRLYRVNGVEVPSVTEVNDILDKPGLPWWGMTVGVAALCQVLGDETLYDAITGLASAEKIDRDLLKGLEVKKIVDTLSEKKLTVNHVRDTAGGRGKSVHDALENWAKNGTMPDPQFYPDTEKGYVQGLRSFLETAKLTPLSSEVMVGSAHHGFAGRYDLRADSTEPVEVVTKLYPKRAPKLGVMPTGEGIVDLKTSAAVYDTHPAQLEAYGRASYESGYRSIEWKAILRVTNDGRYEFVQSRAEFNDFLALLEAYHALKRLKESLRR